MTIALRQIPFQGRRMAGAVVVCGHCGATRTVPVNSFKGGESGKDEAKIAFIVRKLQSDGWLVGKKDSAHRCPGCYSAIKARQAQKSTLHQNISRENVVTLPVQPKAVPQPAPANRMPSHEDKRVIYEKIDDVYLADARCYSGGWSDAKIAADLNVPRAWVANVRDAMFGPEGVNEQIRSDIAEARAVLEQIKAGAPTIALEVLKPLLTKVETIEKKLNQIEKEIN